jgi:hypothetical protein
VHTLRDTHHSQTVGFNLTKMKQLKYFLMTLVIFGTYSLKAQKPELVKYTLFPCDESHYIHTDYFNEGIVNKSLKFDTLTILISTIMNCGSGEKGYIISSGDTINLFSEFPDSIPVIANNGDTIKWEESEMYDCDCCFNLEYIISGITDKDSILTINGKVLRKLDKKYKFPFINQNGDTTVFIDNKGFYHHKQYSTSGDRLLYESISNSNYSKAIYYHKNGQIRFIYETDNLNHTSKTTTYDENGNLIKEEK